jgi:hypothetical protein
MVDQIPKEQRLMHEAIAKSLDGILNPVGPKKIGFVLLTFYFGKMEGGRVNYVSNATREDTIIAMKELLARWEGRYVDEEGQA